MSINYQHVVSESDNDFDTSNKWLYHSIFNS